MTAAYAASCASGGTFARAPDRTLTKFTGTRRGTVLWCRPILSAHSVCARRVRPIPAVPAYKNPIAFGPFIGRSMRAMGKAIAELLYNVFRFLGPFARVAACGFRTGLHAAHPDSRS